MPLKPNPYPIYQGVAFALMAWCWVQVGLISPDRYTPQTKAIYQSMDATAQQQAQEYNKLWQRVVYQNVATQDKGYEAFPALRDTHLQGTRLLRQIAAYKKHLAQFPAHHRKPVAQYMLDQHKAKELKAGLDQYMAWVEQQSKSRYVAYDSVAFAQYTQLSTDDFIKKYFAQATVAEALAGLSHWQFKVYYYTGWFLYAQTDISGYFDKYIRLKALNASKYLAVGDTLSADLVLGYRGIAQALGQSDSYYIEVNGIRMLPNLKHQFPVSFRVSGKGKQDWTAKLVYCADGTEKTKEIKTSYWIR